MTIQDDPPTTPPTCWITPPIPQPLSLCLLAPCGGMGGRGGRGLSWWLARSLVGVRLGRVLTVGVVGPGAGVWVLTSRSVVTSALHNDVAGGGPTCVWERDVSRGEAARCLPLSSRLALGTCRHHHHHHHSASPLSAWRCEEISPSIHILFLGFLLIFVLS